MIKATETKTLTVEGKVAVTLSEGAQGSVAVHVEPLLVGFPCPITFGQQKMVPLEVRERGDLGIIELFQRVGASVGGAVRTLLQQRLKTTFMDVVPGVEVEEFRTELPAKYLMLELLDPTNKNDRRFLQEWGEKEPEYIFRHLVRVGLARKLTNRVVRAWGILPAIRGNKAPRYIIFFIADKRQLVSKEAHGGDKRPDIS